MDEPEKFVNTIHLISSATVAVVGYFQLKSYGESTRIWLLDRMGAYLTEGAIFFMAYLVVAVYLLILIVSLGIIVPKKLGAKYYNGVTRGLIDLVNFIVGILTPITFILKFFAGLVLRIFGIDPNEEILNVTEDEIISMVNEGHEQGVLEEREAEMISNIIELDNKTADDVMVHRKNIVAVDGTWTLKETIEFMISQNYSRFPVFLDDIDNIIGIIHIRNVMERYYGGELCDTPIKDIDGLLMEATFIPESRDIDDLLKEMQQSKVHMDIVVDEYGQTAGIIAMEDIIEEIVGNIFDEYDIEEENIVKKADGIYVVNGLTTLEELADIIDVELQCEDYDTLNGYLIYKLERIPDNNEKIEIEADGYRYIVLSVDNKMISKVQIEKIVSES